MKGTSAVVLGTLAALLVLLPASAGAQSVSSCNQSASGVVLSAGQCSQQNYATTVQPPIATGGSDGAASGGNDGPAIAVGPGASASSRGGNAQANGGNANARNTNTSR